MQLAESKLTGQGQISVPLDVRKALGVGPGSVLEWEDRDGEVIVRRAVRYSSADIHQLLFQELSPEPVSLADMKKALKSRAKKKIDDLNAGH